MIQKSFQEIQLSQLGMGNMRLPTQGTAPGAPIDTEKAAALIDEAMANGINYYDTAYIYHGGASESFLGQALQKYPRESYYLATKFLIGANPDYKAVFEEQLARLQTDYIDFYLVHSVTDETAKQYQNCGCIAYFQQQKALGKIKYLGFSSHASVDTLTQFADCHTWDFAQIQLNYFDWQYGTAKQEYEVLAQRKIPVMVMEPVRGGRLAALSQPAEALLKEAHPDWSIAAWALRFVKNLPQVQVVLSGMTLPQQLADNLEIFSDNTAFTKEDEAILQKACELFHNQVQVPCTACRYCCDDCPAQINIPEYLNVYNRFKLEGPWALQALKDVESSGTPKDCISCGVCTQHCPQNINIPEMMLALAEK